MTSILYCDKPEIGLNELGHIYLALITSADRIFINKNVSISKNLKTIAINHIENGIQTLLDKGLLRFWTYPNDIPSQKQPNVVVFPEKDYSLWNNIINEVFLRGANLKSIFSTGKDDYALPTILEERTSKIIAIRKEYWSLATCSVLNIDHILNSYGSWEPNLFDASISDYNRLHKPLTQKLFDIYGIPNLCVLSGNDVVNLNKNNKLFINTIRAKINKYSNSSSDNGTINFAHDDLIRELLGILDDNIKSRAGMFVEGLFWNALGLFIPPASFVPNANEFFTELSQKRKYGFLYFMSKVKRSASTKMLKARDEHTID